LLEYSPSEKTEDKWLWEKINLLLNKISKLNISIHLLDEL
jgi:hypothetical protein